MASAKTEPLATTHAAASDTANPTVRFPDMKTPLQPATKCRDDTWTWPLQAMCRGEKASIIQSFATRAGFPRGLEKGPWANSPAKGVACHRHGALYSYALFAQAHDQERFAHVAMTRQTDAGNALRSGASRRIIRKPRHTVDAGAICKMSR